MGAESVGELELVVLGAVMHLGKNAYGAEIRRDVSARAGRDYSVGAIYASLQRLEEKRLLRSSESDPLPIRGGRSRRYFTLTAAGKAAVNKGAEAKRRLWAGLAPARGRT